MKFWEDVCTYKRKKSLWHKFALLLTVLAVVSVLIVGHDLYKGQASPLDFAFSCAMAVIVYMQWKHCRKWYEFFLWGLLVQVVANRAGSTVFTRKLR